MMNTYGPLYLLSSVLIMLTIFCIVLNLLLDISFYA